jgi:hypothetical protein
MEEIRFTEKPVNRRIMIELPAGMDADIVEVIVRPSKRTALKTEKCRQPPLELAGTIIHGDLISPAVSESEWDVLQ